MLVLHVHVHSYMEVKNTKFTPERNTICYFSLWPQKDDETYCYKQLHVYICNVVGDPIIKWGRGSEKDFGLE